MVVVLKSFLSHNLSLILFSLLQGVNIFQLHFEDFLWKHFADCKKIDCKWCNIQEVIDVTKLDESMNGQALQREFGNLTAKAMFRKLAWASPAATPTPAPKNDKGPPTRTNELVEQWKKNKAGPDQKKCRVEKSRRQKDASDNENDDLSAEKPVEKRKKN